MIPGGFTGGSRPRNLAAMLAALLFAGVSAIQLDTAIAVIPRPVAVTRGSGAFTVTATTVIAAPAALRPLALALADALAPATGWRLAVRAAPGQGRAIALRLDRRLALLGDEGYRLEVTPRRVTITM